jgi:hypothetical protein
MRLESLFFLSLAAATQAQAFTLANTAAIKAYDCTICAGLSHESLNLSWATKNKIIGHKTLHKQTSRKYQIKTNLQELNKGVAIYTEAPGALIRISPVMRGLKFSPELEIKNVSQNKGFSLKEASSQFIKNASLQGTEFTENTLAFAALKPELGAGKFILSSPATHPAFKTGNNSEYIVQIYDQNSSTYLTIETDKARYQYGDEMTAIIILRDTKLNYPLENITASLVDYKGERTPLEIIPISSTVFKVKSTLLSEKNTLGENWYIEAMASAISGDRMVYRQAHTGFSYAIPSAAIRELKRTNPATYDFSAQIDVATDSRYALQAVLFGTDAKGNMKAIQTVQSAAWLVAGENTLNFSFDPALNSDYKAPYYLGYIHLNDYGQNKPVFEYDNPIELKQLS